MNFVEQKILVRADGLNLTVMGYLSMAITQSLQLAQKERVLVPLWRRVTPRKMLSGIRRWIYLP